MPPNRYLIESKWVLKTKRDVLPRARLVERGYTQILGVDFTNNYLPVVTDVTLCFILLMWLINKWDSHTIFVETYFLFILIE